MLLELSILMGKLSFFIELKYFFKAMLSFVMASSILLESIILSLLSVIKIGIVVFLLIISSGKSKSEFSLAFATVVKALAQNSIFARSSFLKIWKKL